MFLTPHFSFIIIVISLFSQSCFAQTQTTEISHYIFPEFVDGVVLMKNGRRNNVAINYNSISEEMIFTKGSLKLAIGNTESELIDTIYMDDRKFVRLEGMFMEVLYQSARTDLFVQYKCRVQAPGKSVGYGGTSETSAVDNYSTIQGDARLHELDLPDAYIAKPYVVYWVKKNGVVKEAASMKQLEKLFKKQKQAFRDFIKENKVSFDEPAKIGALVSHLDPMI